MTKEIISNWTVKAVILALFLGLIFLVARTGLCVDGNPVLSPLSHHFIGTVIDPHTLYATDHEICIWQDTDAAITVTSIKITCDTDPATELDIDLKWADAFIGLANAAVIDICDTTVGTTDISADFDDATVASSKCIYWSFGAEPIAAITQFNFDITWDYD